MKSNLSLSFITFLLVTFVSSTRAIDVLSDGTVHGKLTVIPEMTFHDDIWTDTEKCLDGSFVKGNCAELGQFPFVARLQIFRSNTNVPTLCSGSFIQEDRILTAAHCLSTDSHLITKIEILVGSVDLNSEEGVKMQATEFWIHPYYKFFDSDIALIRPSTNVPLEDPNVGIIQIPSRAQSFFFFYGPVTLIGWGIERNKTLSQTLKFANFNAVLLWHDNFIFDASKIYFNDPRKCSSSSGGDSGGPIVMMKNDVPIQVGVHFGQFILEENNFQVGTRISFFLDWLEAYGVRVKND